MIDLMLDDLCRPGSHFVSFDTAVLPYEKIRTWYLPPVKEEDEYETGTFML